MGQAGPSINIADKTKYSFNFKVILCIRWNQSSVYYELLKLGETTTGDHYRQQLMLLSEALQDKTASYNMTTTA